MRDNEDHTTDKLVRNERRGIWLALVMVQALALTLLMGSDTRRALLTALPIAIVVAMIWLAQSLARKRDRDVVTHDELRQTALAHAYRWAFLVVLAALAGFCLSSTVLAFDLSAQMLAALTVTLGASAFLALFLLFDRA
jgi:Mn2+/Fe2+ NRAMP family transporter